ncbi:MAG: FtsX-like permease family protein [Oscillospiraceae bacterium]|nr:FtsX-like permease family protein [Oscillospiraceae bacterium]
MMRYESLLASRYIKAQKRQSVFTCVSIIAAVAVMTMVFVLYSVCMDCMESTFYSSGAYHLIFSELTEEQAEAMADFDEVRSLQLERTPDGVSAYVLFGSDIGDRELWLMNASKKIGAFDKYERSKYNSMHGAYKWNDNLMKIDSVYDGGHLVKLRIFCIFFIFAILIAVALRMIIDTAFEVSSKERERHYGVLQSIGATPEQIVRIITSEGLRLCMIAIPFGLIAGIGFAYLMYNVLLNAGLADLFEGMTAAKLSLPFSVDIKMLLVAAVVGIVWVFLSAYGVGMRIIKKTPMEAITARANNVEKVRKRTLSGLLFGISGSIASRNARRQKKRFVVTVLTLTVSITMFSLFSTLTETIERSVSGFISTAYYGQQSFDFEVDIGNPVKGISYAEAEQALRDSGLFENIAVSTLESVLTSEDKDKLYVSYVNREAYTQYFGADATVSYDELVRSGGYVYIANGEYDKKYAEQLQSGSLPVFSNYCRLPDDADTENMRYVDRHRKYAKIEQKEHTLSIIGPVSMKNENKRDFYWYGATECLYGAIETHEQIQAEWFGEGFDTDTAYANFSFAGSSAEDYQYNAADYKKAQDWLNEHTDLNFTAELNPDDPHCWYEDFYGIKWKTHSIMATVRAGVLMLNILLALSALINLMNIISTGIANRRSELASLQCVGMTDRQLDRMAIIECLQFAGAAAIISALICGLVIFGVNRGLAPWLARETCAEEADRTAMENMLTDMLRIDCIAPMVRIVFSALAAFAAGCITSLVMLRVQNTESLTDQVRGSEMKLDTKKSHILRNSILAVAGAFVLVIAGLRIYSVAAYHHDRDEYAKAGYLNLVDGKDTRINVYSTGVQNGKHTFVGLSGMGIQCYPIYAKTLNERLGKENTVVYADRPGYGFSDDSYKRQTLEEVVENLRAGLKNAGFAAPYVLMPHSYASFYALWWQARYPEEVEAIIFMDCTDVPKNEHWRTWTVDNYPSKAAAYAEARRYWLRTWLGLDRLNPLPKDEEDLADGRSVLTQEQLKLIELTENRQWSAAMISQDATAPEAARELRELLKPTDTPKLWFSTISSCEEDIREGMEFVKADYEAAGLKYKQEPEAAAKAMWQSEEWYCQDYYDNTLTPFLEQCGNCRLVPIGGYHHLFYAQKPDEVADTILDFLAAGSARLQ